MSCERSFVLWLSAAMLAVTVPPCVRAQSAREDADALFESRFIVDDEDPSRHIPSAQERDAAPLDFAYFLMNLSERAAAAEQRSDHYAQIRYLTALAAAVPDRSFGFSKLCAAYTASSQWLEAERSCGAAITLPGAIRDDFARYARAVFAEDRDLATNQITQIRAVAAHLEHEDSHNPILTDIQCQLALRTKLARHVRACTAALQSLPEAELRRVSYSWSLAMAKHDYTEAGMWIERAKKSSLSAELIDRMTQTRITQMPWWRRALEPFLSRLHHITSFTQQS
jgi:hypothetical protein